MQGTPGFNPGFDLPGFHFGPTAIRLSPFVQVFGVSSVATWEHVDA